MLKRWKWIILIMCGVFALAMAWSIHPLREPVYHGCSMSEWVARSRSADGSSFEPSEEVREALVVIGTNNLRLL
ncbi:MAG: hypothetical protein DME23_27640, partial [Verrucomicrobia bacterium]